MKTAYINTFTGIRFRLPDPEPDMISLEDIAHSLSLICRFNGHCKYFYSVAQHCISVSQMLLEKQYPPKLQLYGLLHDASEAYICDIPGPIKQLIPEYRNIEKEIQRTVLEAFKLPPPSDDEQKLLKIIDNVLNASEIQEMLLNDSLESYNMEEMTRIHHLKPAFEVEREFLNISKDLMRQV